MLRSGSNNRSAATENMRQTYQSTTWHFTNTDKPVYTDTWYNDKFRYNDNLGPVVQS